MKNPWTHRDWLFPKYLPIAIFLFSMCLAVAGTWWLNFNLQNKREIDFHNKAERMTVEIERRFATPLYALNGTKSVFGMTQEVTQTQFHNVLKTRDLSNEFKGMRGIGLVEAVEHKDLDAYVKKQQHEISPDFEVQTLDENSHNTHYLTKYFVSSNSNHVALGADLGLDPRGRTAIEHAISTGKPSMSDLMYAPPKEARKASVILFVPVFKNNVTPITNEARHQQLIGILYSPIIINDLLANVNEVDSSLLQYRLSNITLDDQNQIISFNSHPNHEFSKLKQSAQFQFSRVLTVYGKDIQFEVASTPTFEVANNHSIPILFFIAATLISGLITALLRLQLTWSEQTQDKLDAAVRDNQALLSTLNMHAIVSVTDAHGIIVDVNEAFCRISGYKRDELIGQNHRISRSGLQSNEFWQEMWTSISQGTPWRGEVCNRTKDGTLYWVDTFVAPFKNSDNVIEKYIAIRTDISESKRAEEQLQAALRDSDALLSTLNMHAIVSIADSSGRIIDVNQAYCRISGYTREEILDGNHRIVAAGIQSPDFLSNMWRTISSGTPWRGEVCNKNKAGTLYWVDTFIAPFKNAQGQIEKFISIRTDISASKKAASRLASQRSALANIIEGTNVGTWEWNVQTGEMRINERWAEQAGYEINEITPVTLQTWDGMTHPEDLAKAKALMQKHFKHGLPYYECETRIKHKQGHWIWVLTRGRLSSMTESGKPEWISGTQMDITERKNADAEIQRSNQLLLAVRDQLTKAAEVAELGIWTWDLGSDEFSVNHRMFDIYAVPEQKRGEKLPYQFWLSMIHPDDIREIEARLSSAIKESQSYAPIFRIVTPGNDIRYIQAAGSVERNNDGRAILMTGINRDITLQYRAEEALRQAKQAADDANQAKSAFLANMSHEIRTPMNAILGMLKLLRRTPLSDQQEDYASKTEGAARSLLSLLNNILDISKVESGKMYLDIHPFRLSGLIDDLQVILGINKLKPSLSFEVITDLGLPENLIGDEMRLRQVLTNLGSNAIKFTKHGKVTLSLRMAELDAHSVTIIFSVKDTGIGIAPENHQRIFSGFTQAEASTTRRYGGTGLGISISHALVDMMGGELKLESALGQGSHFYFSLKLKRSIDEHTEASTPIDRLTPRIAHMRLQGMQILLVEDNPNNQQVAVELLSSEGATIRLANNGVEAINAIAADTHQFHLVLMDLQMPIMDGYTATQKIRQDLGRKTLPIIAMTANAMESDREACLKAGLNDHVGKPFDLHDLINTILRNCAGVMLPPKPTEPISVQIPEYIQVLAEKYGIDIPATLNRLGGKLPLYQRMLQMFIRDLEEAPPKMQNALQDQNTRTIQRILHTMKGLSGTLGATTLAGKLAEQERQLPRHGDLTTLKEKVSQITELLNLHQLKLERLYQELVKITHQHPDAISEHRPSKLDPKRLRDMLTLLREQLANADMEATATMLLLNGQVGMALEQEYQLLESAVNRLDFDTAQQLCNNLLESTKN